MIAEISLDGHIAVFGETQSGKTTTISKYVGNVNDRAVLVIDIEDMNDFDTSKSFNMNSELDELKESLENKEHVRYVPNEFNEETREQEIKMLVRKLLTWEIPVALVADEIQFYGSSGSNLFDPIAVRGLKRDIVLISITQRPANLSKTIASQSKKFVFFELNDFEKRYFESYQLPYDKIQKGWESVNHEPYYFQVYDRASGLSDPLKVSV